MMMIRSDHDVCPSACQCVCPSVCPSFRLYNLFKYYILLFFLQLHDVNEAQEQIEGRNDGNVYSPHLSTETEEEVSQDTQEEKTTRPRENKYSQHYGKRKQLRDELPQEIKAARREMDEPFELMTEKKDDEYEIYGRLLASKLKKIRNPNTRDILMNDIDNLVFRACMADRLDQSAVPQFSISVSSPHQAFSPSSNSST